MSPMKKTKIQKILTKTKSKNALKIRFSEVVLDQGNLFLRRASFSRILNGNAAFRDEFRNGI